MYRQLTMEERESLSRMRARKCSLSVTAQRLFTSVAASHVEGAKWTITSSAGPCAATCVTTGRRIRSRDG